MAILNGKYKVKNSQNSYDVVHLETSASQVKFDDGSNVKEKINEVNNNISLSVQTSKSYTDNSLDNIIDSVELDNILKENLKIEDNVEFESITIKDVVAREKIKELDSLTLGVHTDGMIYLFKNGEPIGNPIKNIPTGEIDLSEYAKKTELHSHTNKSVLDGITSAKVTEWNNKSIFSGNYNDLTNKPTIPTKTSQLNNDSNYLTSIPSEYVTESELIAKGYATQTELNNKLNKNFGSENVGKILAVGSDGNLALMDMPSGDIGGDIAGFVDGDNNIILMGALPNGTYALKYENIDGTYTNIGDLVVGTIVSPEPEPTFTNLAEYNATNTSDFTVWCNDSRMGSDGSYRQLLGYATTNYIEVKKGDVIRIKGFNYETQKYPTMCVMDSSKTNLYNSYYLEMLKSQGFISDVTESESYAEFTIGSANIGDNIAYIRLAAKPTNGGENVIITKNEEII